MSSRLSDLDSVVTFPICDASTMTWDALIVERCRVGVLVLVASCAGSQLFYLLSGCFVSAPPVTGSPSYLTCKAG